MNKRISKKKISLFQESILTWFKDSGRHHLPWRKEGLTSFEIVIAEILLQRTKAETIEKFYTRFLQQFSNWETIANEAAASFFYRRACLRFMFLIT